MTETDELALLANEELEAACSLSWTELSRVTPWGDSYSGFAPSGGEVEFERRYLWAHDDGLAPGQGVLVEVEVRAGGRLAEARRVIRPPV